MRSFFDFLRQKWVPRDRLGSGHRLSKLDEHLCDHIDMVDQKADQARWLALAACAGVVCLFWVQWPKISKFIESKLASKPPASKIVSHHVP
jgi:hypothetical protein